MKRDTKKYLGNDVPETISNQFLDLKYRCTAYQRVYKNGKAYKGKYKVVTSLVYEVAAKNNQSQVSTGPAYINGRKVNVLRVGGVLATTSSATLTRIRN